MVIVVVVALVVLGIALIVLWAACDLVARTVRDNRLSQFRIKFWATLLMMVGFGIEIESHREPDEQPLDDAGGPSSRLRRGLRALSQVVARELRQFFPH